MAEFGDEASAILRLRLIPIEIAPPGPGWRITLPKTLAAIMQIRPKESTVAILFPEAHLEIWTMDLIRKSMSVPLSEFI